MSGSDALWYPAVRHVVRLHADIVRQDPDATRGIEDERRIGFAIDYVEHGHFGKVPGTVHEKAFHLMRLLAANHWFADGNKRTALNTTELFYRLNGYELDYGEDIRSMLKLFSVREELVDGDVGPEYLGEQTSSVSNDRDSRRASDLVSHARVTLTENSGPGESVENDERPSIRDQFDLTRPRDGTINRPRNEREDTDGG